MALIVTEARSSSVYAITEILQTIASARTRHNPNLALAAVVVNRWTSSRVDRRAHLEVLSADYGKWLLNPPIPEQETVSFAATSRPPVPERAPTLTGCLPYPLPRSSGSAAQNEASSQSSRSGSADDRGHEAPLDDPAIAGLITRPTRASTSSSRLTKLTVHLEPHFSGPVRAAFAAESLPSGHTSLSGLGCSHA